MEKTRFIKTLTFAANKNEIDKMEDEVNSTSAAITYLGGKIVTHYCEKHGVSPIYLIHFIVYEHETPLSKSEITSAKENLKRLDRLR